MTIYSLDVLLFLFGTFGLGPWNSESRPRTFRRVLPGEINLSNRATVRLSLISEVVIEKWRAATHLLTLLVWVDPASCEETPQLWYGQGQHTEQGRNFRLHLPWCSECCQQNWGHPDGTQHFHFNCIKVSCDLRKKNYSCALSHTYTHCLFPFSALFFATSTFYNLFFFTI